MKLLEQLKTELGEPKYTRSSGKRDYCTSMLEEIKEARAAGYSLKILSEFLSKKSGLPIRDWHIHYVLYGKKRSDDDGYLIQYKIDNDEITEWRKFINKASIEEYLGKLANSVSKNKGYKVSYRLLSAKKMNRKIYETR